MGQLDLFLACFGMREIAEGRLARRRPAGVDQLAARRAARRTSRISLLPEDRKTEALFLKLTGKHNVSLPVIDALQPRPG